MKRNLIAAAVYAALLCTVLAVTAHSTLLHTPLYTIRMEQVSSRMNFLPQSVNEFTYTAKNECTLNYRAGCCTSVEPLEITWEGDPTCSTCDQETCYGTTCEQTACGGNTCSTCTQPTCETCETCSTCPTQSSTCWNTCAGPTCKPTCEIDC